MTLRDNPVPIQVHCALDIHKEQEEFLTIINCKLHEVIQASGAIDNIVASEFLYGVLVVPHHLFADGTKIV